VKSVSEPQSKFGSVIVCEDIRDEIGNKKSLMGVMGGDILVPNFPATLKIAIYMEYHPDAKDREHLSLEIRLLQDDTEIAKGKMESAKAIKGVATFVLPTGLITFDKEVNFKLLASVNGRPEQEILNKKVTSQTTYSSES